MTHRVTWHTTHDRTHRCTTCVAAQLLQAAVTLPTLGSIMQRRCVLLLQGAAAIRQDPCNSHTHTAPEGHLLVAL
jgi:hypothetical protein